MIPDYQTLIILLFKIDDDFREYYRDAVEDIPPRTPEIRGRHVYTTTFVDAALALKQVTEKFQTGFVILSTESLSYATVSDNLQLKVVLFLVNFLL